MARAKNKELKVTYQPELVYGVLDTAGTPKEFGFTGFGLNPVYTDIEDTSLGKNGFKLSSDRGSSSVEGDVSVVARPDVFDPFLEVVMGNTFATNVLTMANVEKSLSFEEFQSDIGRYQTYLGVVFGSMEMSLSANQSDVVTWTFSGTGSTASLVSPTSQFSTAPIVLPTPSSLKNAGGHFMLGSTGGTLANTCITSFDMSIDRSTEAFYCLASQSPDEIDRGQASVTGSLTAAYTNENLFNAYMNEEFQQMQVRITNGTSNYTFDFHKVKLTSGDKSSTEANGKRLLQFDWEAFYDTENDRSPLTITKS